MEEGHLGQDTLEDDPQAGDSVEESPLTVKTGEEGSLLAENVEEGRPAPDYAARNTGLC